MISCLRLTIPGGCTDTTHMSQVLASRMVPLLEGNTAITAVPLEDSDMILLGIPSSAHIHELAVGRHCHLAGSPGVAVLLICARISTGRQSEYGRADNSKIAIAFVHSESSESCVEL